MEDFCQHNTRKVPRTELQRQQNYLDLVPRSSEEEYRLLKDSIERNGLHPGHPILVNDDDVVLDGYTRLQIADELNAEWVWVQTLEFEDHYAEKMFIIETNLLRRHLTAAQRGEMALKFLDYEQARARERQRQAGIAHKDNLKKGQDSPQDKDSSRLTLNSEEAGGEAMKVLAHRFKVGRDTLYRVQKIKEAAQVDPDVGRLWEAAVQGEASVNELYQLVQQKEEKEPRKIKPMKARKDPYATMVMDRIQNEQKALEDFYRELREPTYLEIMTRRLPDPDPFPDGVLMKALYDVADMKQIPRAAIDGAFSLFPDLIDTWRAWSQDLFDPQIAWWMTEDWINVWLDQKRAERPEEQPLPADAEKLGPWVLDMVHRGELKDLVREFPESTAHLVYSDAVADLEQLSLLGEFAARVLTLGKYLCVYVDKRLLPGAMSRLSAAGLRYFWACSVFRPEDRKKIEEFGVREKWRMLLIYRKGKVDGVPVEGWDWFDDAVESRQPTNRGLLRQLVKGLTMKGQLVVNPVVGSGLTGQVARSLERRYLCFGADGADVWAANQRIKEFHLAAPEGAS